MTDEPIIMVCGVPDDAPPEVWQALAELGRAAAEMEERRRLALTPAERAAEDAVREAGLRRIRERNARLRGRCSCGKAAQPGDAYCADCQVTPGPIEPAR